MLPEPAFAVPTAPTRVCRNCNAAVTGEYCAACGQETQLKLPTARVFMREATGRYFSLDGRMWRTLAALLFRPGFLTREYFAGRRRRYVRPARLFLVLSLALFAALRLFASAPLLVDAGSDVKLGEATDAKPSGEPVVKFDAGEKGGDIVSLPGFTVHVDPQFNLDLRDATHPWALELKKRFVHFNRLNRQEKSEQVFLGVVRYGPYAMFVLLPAFALLQMIVYAGRGRRYPDRPSRYAEHLVFAAHLHALPVPDLRAGAVDPLHPVAGRARHLVPASTDSGRRRRCTAADGSASSRGASSSVRPTSCCSGWSSSGCCWSPSWCARACYGLQAFSTSSLKRASRVSWRARRFSMALIAES